MRSSSVAFRGKVLDALGGRDDPELAPDRAQGLPEPCRRTETASHRAPDRTSRLDQGASGRHRGEANPAVGAERQPAPQAPEEQGPRDRQPREGALGHDPRGAQPAARANRRPDEDARSARRPAIPSPARPSSTSSAPSATRSTARGRRSGRTSPSNGRNDFDQLLSNVFDPSLVIGPGYQATTVATTDGRVLTGLLAEDGKDRVVLKIQGGKLETIPRGQIDEIKTSPLSLMPEEIEKQLSPQEIADLFAFLCLDKPPSDPTARPLPGAGPISRRAN